MVSSHRLSAERDHHREASFMADPVYGMVQVSRYAADFR